MGPGGLLGSSAFSGVLGKRVTARRRTQGDNLEERGSLNGTGFCPESECSELKSKDVTD